MNPIMYSSRTDNWATPQAFFDKLNKEFNFTLDPCVTKGNAKCTNYFTPEINGLVQSWEGYNVFFVTLPMANNFRYGCKKPTKKAENQTLWL